MTTRKRKIRVAPEGEKGFSLISDEKLRALYAAMLQCRMLEKQVRSLVPGKQRAALQSRGREASAAGVILDLLPGDALCAPSGDLASRLLKGVALKTILSRRRKGSDVLAPSDLRVNVFPPLDTFADRLDLAMRAAQLGAREKRIAALIFDSEEAADEAWEEALRLAATERLPLLFVCHSRSRKADLTHQAQRCGLPGITVDEADVVAIYRVASEALAHARRGNGPTLIECRRWAPRGARRHGRSGGDAIRNMEAYLGNKGLFSGEFKARVISRFKDALEKAGGKTRGRGRKPVAKRR
ncbi:MAG TPA: thiamine pyrophosphate-dependent enzyme [Terracidiphilus sp.]|nr:thiamine pyrophosphate-dependent enzyme [Terracidiphilus sp.]